MSLIDIEFSTKLSIWFTLVLIKNCVVYYLTSLISGIVVNHRNSLNKILIGFMRASSWNDISCFLRLTLFCEFKEIIIIIIKVF